jgi:uncharacterized membrane protein
MESSSAWFWVLFWWLAFCVSHVVLSSIPVRTAIIARTGAQPFQGLYSLVALATFVPMVSCYWGKQHTGPLLWSFMGYTGAEAVGVVLGTAAFSLTVASFFQPSPTSMDPRAAKRPHGLTRVTRHPLFAGFALWGLAHVLINGFLSDLAFFSGFVVFSIVGAAHQDARKKVQLGAEYEAFCAETSFVPFVAILGGRNRLVLGEMPWIGLAVGAAAGVGLYLLHPTMFG